MFLQYAEYTEDKYLSIPNLFVVCLFFLFLQTLSDVWLLEMGSDEWKWTEIEVRNLEHAPPASFGHPACKVCIGGGGRIDSFTPDKSDRFTFPTFFLV